MNNGWLTLIFAAWAHQGVVLPWDSDEIDYAQAPPDAWMALDLHVSVVLGISLFAWLFYKAVTDWRVRYGWSDTPLERWRGWMFGVAQVVLFLSLNGPIHHLSDYYLFSAHMFQHLLLTLVWAPLTVAAVPDWLVEAAVQVPWVRRIAELNAKLPFKFLLFNGMLYFWHIPYFYNLAVEVHPVHIAEHLGFMITAVMVWVGILCSAPSLPPPNRFFQMVFLFVMSLPMKLLGAIITLTPEVIYTCYLDAPRVWGLTPEADQLWGGLMMWVPGGLSLWAAMIVVFSRWWREEHSQAPQQMVEGHV